MAQNAARDIAKFDGTGQLLGTNPATGLRNPVQYFGGWVGNSDYGLRAVVGSFDDATYWNATRKTILWSGEEQYGFGNRANQGAPPIVPRISVKCRPVAETFPISFAFHCYIVVKNEDGSLQTIEGGEETGQATGTLEAFVKAGDAVDPNKSTDPATSPQV